MLSKFESVPYRPIKFKILQFVSQFFCPDNFSHFRNEDFAAPSIRLDKRNRYTDSAFQARQITTIRLI